MKKFIFKLETVLKVKIRAEELKKEALRAAEQLAAEATQELAACEEKARLAQADYQKRLEGRLQPQLLLEYQRYGAFLNGEIQRAATVLQEANQKVTTARESLITATKERKALEKLKEKAYQDYLQKELREENKFLDELGTGRYLRRENNS